ncbi:DUF397 domain-containing protein [Amycolatopsis sp. NPDC051716]|uniref:DUF397 domain-containing protein n=1 Tax=Amycolatopsis sp. NPDC051716 TaxID=3155804 RepID=UPI003412EF4C
MEIDEHGREWRKSSRCNDPDGGCVELVVSGGLVRIRDSWNRAGGMLVFSSGSWSVFLARQKEQWFR